MRAGRDIPDHKVRLSLPVPPSQATRMDKECNTEVMTPTTLARTAIAKSENHELPRHWAWVIIYLFALVGTIVVTAATANIHGEVLPTVEAMATTLKFCIAFLMINSWFEHLGIGARSKR